MSLLVVAGFAGLLALVYNLVKYPEHPAFVWGAVWTFVVSVYVVIEYFAVVPIRQVSGNSLLFYLAGFAFFACGSVLASGVGRASRARPPPVRPRQHIDGRLSLFLHAFVAVMLPLYVLRANQLVGLSSIQTDSWLRTLRFAMNADGYEIGILAYALPIAFFNFFLRVLGYGTRRDYFLALGLAVAYAFLSTGRTLYLLFLVVIAGDLLIRKKYSYVGYTVAAFFGIFVLIGSVLSKLDVSGGGVGGIAEGILVYMLGGLVAFDYQVLGSSGWAIEGVANTLRTPAAVLSSVGLLDADQVPSLVREFVFVPFPTNVYTVYEPYFLDFGYFSLLVVGALGWASGYLYRFRNRSAQWRYYYLLSLYPIVTSIFQDQFLSLLSLWVQFVALYFVFAWFNDDPAPRGVRPRARA